MRAFSFPIGGIATGGGSGFVHISGDTMTGPLTLNPAVQVNPNDAATIGQVTALTTLAAFKQLPAVVATTANITLSGTQTIDGVAVIVGDRVLVKNQTNNTENGIYVVAAGAWTRSTDADTSAELTAAAIGIASGTANAGTSWIQVINQPTIGVSPIIWNPLGIVYFASGLGIVLTGNTFGLQLDGTTLTQSGSGVKVSSVSAADLAFLAGVGAFTQGSVVFAGATGLAEDNANFFYDDANNRLCIDTNTSRTSLTIGAFPALTAYPTADTFGIVLTSTANGVPTKLIIENAETTQGSAGGGNIILSHRTATPSFAAAGSRLGGIHFSGSISNSTALTNIGASIDSTASNLWTAVSSPTNLNFYTTAVNSTSLTLRARIFTNGGMTVGSTPTTQVGTFNINPLGTGSIGLMVRGLLLQTGDLASFQNSDGGIHSVCRIKKGGAISIEGLAGEGYLDLLGQSAPTSNPAATVSRVYSDSLGHLSVRNSSGFEYKINNNNLTADSLLQLQNLAGYIVANVPTTAGLVLSNGTTLSSKIRSNLRTTITQSVASVTPTAVTELTTASLPIGNYKFSGVFVYQSTSGAVGIGLRMNAVTATMTTCSAKWSVAQAANGVNQNFEYDQVAPTTNVTTASVPTVNTDALAWAQGTFTVTVAGTVAIELRSETGTSVSIRAGSFLSIEEL